MIAYTCCLAGILTRRWSGISGGSIRRHPENVYPENVYRSRMIHDTFSVSFSWYPVPTNVIQLMNCQRHWPASSCVSHIPQIVNGWYLPTIENRLKSAYRCSLDQETIGNYLYVHTNMPLLSGFDPRPAVLHWLSVKERRHRETPNASKQEWFSTVFFGSNEVEIQRERSNSKVVKKF